MTTKIEALGSFRKPRYLGEVLPGDVIGPLENYSPQGERELVLFGCDPDNSETLFFRLKPDLDTELFHSLPEALRTGMVDIIESKVLKPGQSYIIEARKRTDSQPRLIQITHQIASE